MCFNGGCELGTGIQVPGSGGFFDILGIGSGVWGASRTGSLRTATMGGWIDGLMDGRGGKVQIRARVGQAFLKMDVAAPEDGRTPVGGGSEAFPYWSRRIPACMGSKGRAKEAKGGL